MCPWRICCRTKGKKITIMNKSTSIIILTKDCLEYTKKCLASLAMYTDNFELIIIDNGSRPETVNYLKQLKLKNLRLVFNRKNMGSPYAWDQGIKIAKHDFLAIINNDTLFTPNWLILLQKCFEERPDCGASSPTTCFCGGNRTDKKIKRARFIMSQDDINNYAKSLKFGYINTQIYGFAFLTHKKVIDKIGVFDYRRYGIGTFEETDFFWRADKVGFKSYWVTHAYVHHFGHSTFKESNINLDEIHTENKKKFFDRIANDPNLYIKNDVKVREAI